MLAYVYLLKARLKKIVPVKCLKKFIESKHVPNQKYRYCDEKFPEEECIILFLADTEEKLRQMIEGTRNRKPAMKVLISAGESTETELEEENVTFRSNNKRKTEENLVQDFLKKRLDKFRVENKENTTKIEESNNCNIYKTTVASLRQTNVSLSQEVRDLKQKLKESKTTMETIEAENDRKDSELKTLRELNVKWQETAIEKFNNLQAIYKATIEGPSTLQGGGQFPAVGYITEDESQIHIGRGLYLSMQAWSLALNVPNTRKVTFAKNILVALCGYNYLSKITISGRGSNRNRQSKKPEEQLDPKILLAVRDIYSYYLVTVKKYSAVAADDEAGKVHAHISKKIAQIKDVKKKAYARKAGRDLMGASSAKSEISHSDEEVDMGNGEKVSLSSLSDNLIEADDTDDNDDTQEEGSEPQKDSGANITEDNSDEVDQIDPSALNEEDEQISKMLNRLEEEILERDLVN